MGNYNEIMVYRVSSEGIETDEDVIKSYNTIFKGDYNIFCNNFKACQGQEVGIYDLASFIKNVTEKLPYNCDLYVAQERADLYKSFADTLKRKKYLILKTTINLDGELIIKTLSGREISIDDAISYINDQQIYEEAMSSWDGHKKEMRCGK